MTSLIPWLTLHLMRGSSPRCASVRTCMGGAKSRMGLASAFLFVSRLEMKLNHFCVRIIATQGLGTSFEGIRFPLRGVKIRLNA
jgi:hypothetical protein